MKAFGEIREAFFLKSVAKRAKQQCNCREALLPIHDTLRIVIVIDNEVAYEILRIVLLNGVVPEVFYIGAIPRVGSLETWDAVEGLF